MAVNLGEFEKVVCESYMETDDYKKGIYKEPGYKYCCEQRDHCSFWAQGWFWILVFGLAGLCLVISLVGCIICCIKKRGGGGKDEVFDYDDGDNSEPSDNTKSVMA